MHVFFGVSYSNKIDAEGKVLPEYRHDLEELLDLTRDLGHTAFCAPEHDGWEINNLSPAEAYQTDTAELDKADIFIGYIDSEQPSAGVCMETMRAAMRRIPLQIVTDRENPVYMIKGMVDSEDFASHAVCPDQASRLKVLKMFLTNC